MDLAVFPVSRHFPYYTYRTPNDLDGQPWGALNAPSDPKGLEQEKRQNPLNMAGGFTEYGKCQGKKKNPLWAKNVGHAGHRTAF